MIETHHGKEAALIMPAPKSLKMLDELKLKPQYARGYFYLGELYANGGQKEKARENLEKAETMFQEMGMDYWLVETRKVLAEL